MKQAILFVLVLGFCISGRTQNIGIGTTTPNTSALLELNSTNKGLLIPRMTTSQRNAIATPAKGLIAFDTNLNAFWYYNGTAWRELGGNAYNADSTLIVGQQAGNIAAHNLTVSTTTTDSSGYLYDSGGPAGNYGNNENAIFTIYQNSANQLGIDVQVLSNNLESPYDSLVIIDDYGHRYLLLGNSTGSYRFNGDVQIQFKSNFANTAPGFAIRWNGVYPGSTNNYNATQSTGWYYNPAKNYMRGGINANNNWSPDSSGILSFAYGFNSKAIGDYSFAFGSNSYATTNSISFGNYSNAAGSNSIGLGENAFALGNSSMALGYSTYAGGSNSIALGATAYAADSYAMALGPQSTALGSYSIAMGYFSTTNNMYATAIGQGAEANGNAATAIGHSPKANGISSTAAGHFTVASGDYSTSLGYFTRSKSYGGFAAGMYNDSSNAASATGNHAQNRIFEIGNGSADNARSNAITVLQNGNTGFGTTAPAALLHTKNGAVLFDGASGATPASGAGTRMMWIPAKAAFRAGVVTASRWDDGNIGLNSFSSGYNSLASGENSIAMGNSLEASGNFSVALGSSTIASGTGSFASGYACIASGVNSSAIGSINSASGSNSISIGIGNEAIGSSSFALGDHNYSIGFRSMAMGYLSYAQGTNSIALGLGTKSKSTGGIVVGTYNDSTNGYINRVFQIGNGSNDYTRSNAMTVLQNGNVGIGILIPLTLLDVNGNASFNDKLIQLRNGSDLNHGLRYDVTVNGPYLFGYDGGALGANGYANTLNWNKDGNVSIRTALTVQNGKGIVRSNDATQKKVVSTNVTVNASLPAGGTTSINFTFPESFSANPDVYVGNVISGAGGWAEVNLTVANVSATGGTLYVHNTTTGVWTPNFVVKLIAIGAE